jgi:hypothetical protein
LQRAGHAEMQGQPATTINIRHEMLAVTANCNELGALKAGSECPGGELA